MFTNAVQPIAVGHAHDVDLDDTFDFLNTDDTDNGFPARAASDARRRPRLVRRSGRHPQGRRRLRSGPGRAQPSVAESDLRRDPRGARRMREIAAALVDHRAPDPAALETTNRALHARQVIELVPAPDGVSVDHRHVGDPIDDALARLADPLVDRADRGSPRADQDLRQRHLRVDLLRRLTDESPALVRHGDLREPRQGEAAPRAGRRKEGRGGSSRRTDPRRRPVRLTVAYESTDLRRLSLVVGPGFGDLTQFSSPVRRRCLPESGRRPSHLTSNAPSAGNRRV